MKSATIQELKQELLQINAAKAVELCIKLARFKKENKELLTYLLFEANDQDAYIQSVKDTMHEGFEELPKATDYLNKKCLRKILRITNKFIKFSASKQVETELLMYYCAQIKASSINLNKSIALKNIYLQQIKKIRLALNTLHEDLQYEYNNQLNKL
jgi:hypothetical protein